MAHTDIWTQYLEPMYLLKRNDRYIFDQMNPIYNLLETNRQAVEPIVDSIVFILINGSFNKPRTSETVIIILSKYLKILLWL